MRGSPTAVTVLNDDTGFDGYDPGPNVVLRVIGFTRGEISIVLLGELATLTIIAIPLGLLIGTGMSAAVAAQLDTDMFRVPFVVSLKTYSFAVLIVIIASVASSMLVRRRLDELDLIAVLKTRE